MRARAGEGELEHQLATLDQMTVEALRAEWLRLYRSAPSARMSRDLLIRCIAYRLQEVAYGGLRLAARRKLASLMQPPSGTSKPAQSAVTLRPGSMLVRTWHSQTHTVQVLADGFEHRGQRYRSLSHIAKAITGAHWSGPRFFGLHQPPAPESADAQAG